MAGVLTPCFSAALPRDLGAWRRRSASLAASPPTELGAGCGHSAATAAPPPTLAPPRGTQLQRGTGATLVPAVYNSYNIQTFSTAVMYIMYAMHPYSLLQVKYIE